MIKHYCFIFIKFPFRKSYQIKDAFVIYFIPNRRVYYKIHLLYTLLCLALSLLFRLYHLILTIFIILLIEYFNTTYCHFYLLSVVEHFLLNTHKHQVRSNHRCQQMQYILLWQCPVLHFLHLTDHHFSVYNYHSTIIFNLLFITYTATSIRRSIIHKNDFYVLICLV